MANQTVIIHPEEGAHWYFYDGLPCYELLKSDGSGLRVPTLRDAKKLNLLPSVTTIMKVLYRPALERWKQEQLILASMTLPRMEGEHDYEFASRILEDSRTEGREAADFGTHIHSMVEWYCKAAYLGDLEEDFDFLPDDKFYLRGWKDWADAYGFEPELVELSFANIREGIAGKIDCIGTVEGRRCIIDWKTKKTRSNMLEGTAEPIVFYPEWRPQLAAYKRGLGWDHITDICSVAISNTEPGRVEHKFWDDYEDAWEEFAAMRRLWYSPLGGAGNQGLYTSNLKLLDEGANFAT